MVLGTLCVTLKHNGEHRSPWGFREGSRVLWFWPGGHPSAFACLSGMWSTMTSQTQLRGYMFQAIDLQQWDISVLIRIDRVDKISRKRYSKTRFCAYQLNICRNLVCAIFYCWKFAHQTLINYRYICNTEILHCLWTPTRDQIRWKNDIIKLVD